MNDRFRIFKCKNKKYIIKKTNITDGNLEVQLAQKAIEVIDGLSVTNYTIRVIKPTIYYVDDLHIY